MIPPPLPLRFGLAGSALLLAVSAALWWTGRGDGRLHLIAPPLLGDGFLLKTAAGQWALIDGGAEGADVANWLGDELPLGRRQIDLLVQTRVDKTTLPGQLAAARRYRFDTALLVRPVEQDAGWDELVRLLEKEGTTIRIAQAGDHIEWGGRQEQITIDVLAGSNQRILLNLTHKHGRIMFMQSRGDESVPVLPLASDTALVYPWRRAVDDPALGALAPDVVIFGEQPGRDPRVTLAQRAIGAARTLHEALDGRIDLAWDAGGMQIGVGKSRGK